MGYWEHKCIECKTVHDAAFWYYRQHAGGSRARREYLCGEQYSRLSEKVGWLALEPTMKKPKKATG